MPAALLLALLAQSAAPAQDTAPLPRPVELATALGPPGAAVGLAQRLAGVTPAAGPLGEWPASLLDPAWESAEPWLRWAELVDDAAEAEAPSASSARGRAALALLAAACGRHADAWAHFEACAAEPDVAAALLPRLFPGVPDGLDPTRPLPDGVLLRPCLPPPPGGGPADDPRAGEFFPGRAAVRGLAVGAGAVDLELELARDGVQVNARGAGPAAVELAFVLPEPEAWFVRSDYLDWEKRDVPGEPFRVRLEPGGEASAWGRFAPRRTRSPSAAEASLENLRLRGLRLAPDERRRALARGLAAALERLLALPVTVAGDDGARAGPFEPVVLPVGGADESLAGVRDWMSACEGLVLAGASRASHRASPEPR